MPRRRKQSASSATGESPFTLWHALFYTVPPAAILCILLFVWCTEPPPVETAAAQPAPAKAAKPAKAKPAATGTTPTEAPSEPLVYETGESDSEEGGEDTPSLLDDDAVGEDITDIPPDIDPADETEPDDAADDEADAADADKDEPEPEE